MDIFFFLLMSCLGIFDVSADSLVLAQVVFRHGARAPLSCLTSGEAQKYFFRGLGAISDKGIRESMELGRSLRRRLVDTGFLDNRYIPQESVFYSSPSLPNLMTASAIGSAMFDDTDDYSTPVAVLTDKAEDNYLCVPQSPPVVIEELLKTTGVHPNTIEFTTDDILNLAGPDLIKNATYLNNTELYFTADAVLDEKYHGLQVPAWFNANVEKEAQNMRYRSMSLQTGTDDYFNEKVIKCRSGFLLNTLMNNMKDAVSCKRNCKKFYAYSTHDNMIQPLLASLGILDITLKWNVAPFSSAILIELWKPQDAERYVKVFFRHPDGEFESFTQYIKICNYSELCPISSFASCCNNFKTARPQVDCNSSTQQCHILLTFFTVFLLIVFK